MCYARQMTRLKLQILTFAMHQVVSSVSVVSTTKTVGPIAIDASFKWAIGLRVVDFRMTFAPGKHGRLSELGD